MHSSFCHGQSSPYDIYTHTLLVWPGQMNSLQKKFIYLIPFILLFYCRNCADRHHCEELEVLLSAQGGQHHSHSSHPSPVIPPLSSLLMMQNLGFQWSNCGSFLDTSSSMPPMNVQQHDGHNKIKEEDTLMYSSRSSCASTAIAACHDDIVLDGGGGGSLPAMAAVAADLDGSTVLPSVNISRTTTTTHQIRPFPAAPPPLPGDAFEILASSRLCKTLLLSQASSVLLHNGTMPLLRSEHVPYGPPPPPAAAHPHGPSIDNYKQVSQIEVRCVELACITCTVFFFPLREKSKEKDEGRSTRVASCLSSNEAVGLISVYNLFACS